VIPHLRGANAAGAAGFEQGRERATYNMAHDSRREDLAAKARLSPSSIPAFARGLICAPAFSNSKSRLIQTDTLVVNAPMKLFRYVALLLVAAFPGATCASGDDNRSTIPLTLTQSDYDGGRIYLPVRFGNVMGTMRLDTGASTTRIALAPWNKDLPSVAQSASTGASGKTMECEDVEAKNVELKASQGNNIARTKYEVTRCAASDGDDLLGLDFFKHARFTLDFQRHEMAFFGEAHATGRPKPFRLIGPDQRLVGIQVRAGNTTAVGLFDTGAEVSAVDQQFVDKHKNLFTPVKSKGKASEASGKQFPHKIYKIKELDLGEGLVLRGVYAIAYDFGVLREALGRQTPFILGYNLVSKFNWELDFASPASPTWDAKPK
jgi:hypothetical protein